MTTKQFCKPGEPLLLKLETQFDTEHYLHSECFQVRGANADFLVTPVVDRQQR